MFHKSQNFFTCSIISPANTIFIADSDPLLILKTFCLFSIYFHVVIHSHHSQSILHSLQVGQTARQHWSSENLKASMTKKVPKKILRIERNFFVNLRKNCFSPPTPRRRRRFFGTGGAPPTEIDRRAAADTMTSAHSSI